MCSWPDGEVELIIGVSGRSSLSQLPLTFQVPTVPCLQSAIVKTQSLAEHLKVGYYGDFQLTDAIRPSQNLDVIPCQGYRIDSYRDPKAGLVVPVLAASVTRELLFDVFLGLIDELGPVVDVVLETSHETAGAKHHDLFRSHIDSPVLQSHLCDFEDLLLNDGCTGIAVVAKGKPVEVQFDEHKLLIVYARKLDPFIRVVNEFGISHNERLRLITEGEHYHTSDPSYSGQFAQLCMRLGVGEKAEQLSW